MDAGVCDGMTFEEIEVSITSPSPLRTLLTGTQYQKQYPEDFANRDEDKVNYRYRGA